MRFPAHRPPRALLALLLLPLALAGSNCSEREPGDATDAKASEKSEAAKAPAKPEAVKAPVNPEAAKPPVKPEAAKPAPLSPLELEAFLEAHVRRWGLKDPKNPWALIHALPIVGPEAKLADGQTLVQAILSNATWRTVKGRTFPAFEGAAPDGTPKESHEVLVASALYLAKVPPQTVFTLEGKPTTLGALYQGELWTLEEPKDGRYGKMAWALSAIWAAPGKKTAFTNFRGQTLDPKVLVAKAAANLEAQNAFLHEARASGGPLVKRRQGVFAEPCGGWHFYEAMGRWLPQKKVARKVRPILERVTEISSYRLRAEAQLYDDTHPIAPVHLQRLLWIQELKFFGHYLEAMAVARDGGLAVRPEDIAFARGRLSQAVEALRALHAFDQMELVNAQRHQSYLDLIGDAAHALQGLRAWK